MATNLLLEGDDLEALLVRAKVEGGPHARIVRAEKIRHGGVMGFFAKETFEVAIEVPDEGEIGTTPPAPGLPTRSPVETLLDRIQEQMIDTNDVDTSAAPADAADVAAAEDDPEPQNEADDDTPAARPAFTPFGDTFEAALKAVGVVIAPSTGETLATEAQPQAPVLPQPQPLPPVLVQPEPGPEPVPAPIAEAAPHDAPGPIATAEDADAALDDDTEHESVSDDQAPAAQDPGEQPVVVPASVAGIALAAPTPPAEILGGPGALLAPLPDDTEGSEAAETAAEAGVGGQTDGADHAGWPKARGRRAAGDPGPGLHDMLDPVLAVERSAARSVAGQPLSPPQSDSFRIPLQRNGSLSSAGVGSAAASGAGSAPATEESWQREVAQVAHTAAYAAVYATVHEDGFASTRPHRTATSTTTTACAPSAPARQDGAARASSFAPLEVANRVPGPRHGIPLELPPALSGSWRHSSERGTDPLSGAWDFLPTPTSMVTAFPGSGPHDGSVPHDSSAGARPEFTALLEQLRASAGGGQPDLDDGGRHAQAPVWAMQPETPAEALIPEPIAAEVAWTVVERVEAADVFTEVPAEQPPPIEADLVESIRRQAQEAIDEAFTAAGLSEEAERMADAAATIPMPRRTAPEPDAAAAAPSAELTPSAQTPPDRDRLAVDQETLRRLGVPADLIERMHGGDRYADAWQALEQLPTLDIDPDAAVIAVIGTSDVVQLEAYRIAVDLAETNEPRPVVVVPADGHLDVPAMVGRHRRCVVAIESDGTGDPSQVLESLGTVDASAVIVVLDAEQTLSQARSWLFSLGRVDALALDGVAAAAAPAQMLELGLPVVRLDGIPIDRMTWTALLCAQLEAANPAR